MNKIISIVIPTYNMEKYLDRCLSSLLIKRISDIEVIIVNDGSKDSSLSIAQKYESMYPDTFSIIDKSNGNYGSCINAALKVAKGKYIKILDADDAFNSNNFNFMISVLEDLDADMILTDFVRVYGDGKEDIESFNLQDDTILDFSEITRNKDVTKIMMHSVTYKLENLLNIGYKQSEGIFYTDNEWIFLPISTVRKVYYIKKPIYLYTLNREGQSIDCDVEKLHSLDNIKVSCSLLIANSSLKNEHIPNEVKEYLNTKLYNRIRHNYKDFIILNKCLDINQLQILDDMIYKDDSNLYKKLNKILLSAPLFSFHYIKIWRRKHNSRKLAFIVSAYRKYKRHK